MTALVDAQVTSSGARERVTGLDLGWPAPTAAAPPGIPVTGFGTVEAAITLDGSAALTLDVPPSLATARSVAVELVAGWDAVAEPMTLLGGMSPITIRLVDRDGPTATIEATVRTNLGNKLLRADVPTPTVAIAVAVVAGGSDAVLAISGTAVDRRPLPVGSGLTPAIAEAPILVGGADGATELFTGRLWALRVHDGAPETLVATVTGAADTGMGELDARFELSGGAGGPLGAVTQSEQVVGGVRWREHERATLCWSASTGVHSVAGTFRDHYRASGGPLGSLGLPSSDDLSMAAYLDLINSKRRKRGESGLRLSDMVVERVPRISRVIDVEDVPALIRATRAQFTEELASRPWTEAVVSAPLTFQGVRVSAQQGSALVNATTVTQAPHAAPISAAVLESMVDQIDAARGYRRLQPVRSSQHRGGEPIEAPVETQVEVQREAVDLATAFVRNTDVAVALTRWAATADEPVLSDSPSRLIADLVAEADRAGRLVRIVDEDGLGWVLQGPRAQRFERGAIIWAPGVRAVTLFTDILVHWLRHGGSDGFLGMPESPDIATGSGRTARFANGLIAWSPVTSAHEVHGAILATYLDKGGATGFLGFPISDEEDVPGVPGAKRSTFQGGDIYWSVEHGSHVLLGGIREAYLQRGGSDRYGLPVTDEVSWVAGDGSGVEVRHTTFSNGEVLAWVNGIGVFAHVVLDVGSVRSGEIDDEVTSDDQPELYVLTTVWVDGAQVVSNRTPSRGYGPTAFALDAIAPVVVPLHAGATIRIEVKAWDEDTGPDDHFATHDATYSFENGFFGWLSVGRGSHLDAPSTWDNSDTDPDDFTVSYTLAPPFDELARFDRFRQDMFWQFENFSGPNSLGLDMFSETFEDVVDSSGSPVVDNVLHPVDRIFYAASYKGVAQKGNCMGMSLLAADTFHRRTGLTQPLAAHGESDVLKRAINRAHGIQTGDAAMIYKLMVKGVPGQGRNGRPHPGAAEHAGQGRRWRQRRPQHRRLPHRRQCVAAPDLDRRPEQAGVAVRRRQRVAHRDRRRRSVPHVRPGRPADDVRRRCLQRDHRRLVPV